MNNTWPKINYENYKETLALVHMLSQIVGKIRLRSMPWMNHSWHTSLYVSTRGFTTGSIPYSKGLFEIELNFIDHFIHIKTSEGQSGKINLQPDPISEFYHNIFNELNRLGIKISIYPCPNEIEPAIPFADDHRPQVYDPEEMKNLWMAFVSTHKVFQKFRASFIGKSSPVHLFWGAFDLAVTRFSGRKAPLHPGGMPNIPLKVMQEAYSHEVSSAGFWPGSADFPQPVYYAYSYPTPEEYGKQKVAPDEAFYSEEMGEFFLPYEAVWNSKDPENTLFSFLETTHQAAAYTADWNTNELEFDFSEFELEKNMITY